MKHFLLLVSILFMHALHSQNYVVCGRVFSPDDTPLGKVQVSDGSKIISTNSDGKFVCTAQFLPNVYTFKHPHYGEKEVFVNLPQPGLDTMYINIYMTGKETELEEITISSARVIWAYPKAHVHIIDFDLYGEQMLLLCKQDNQYLMRLVNAYNEPLQDVPIPRHPKSLFRDCTGNLHILYKDSVFPVTISGDQLQLGTVQSRKQMETELRPCVASIGNLLIFERSGTYRQTIDFVAMDTLSHKVTRMYYLSNRKYRRALEEFKREIQQQDRTIAAQMATNSVEEQLEQKKRLELQQQYLDLLNRPVYAPVLRLKDSILIFDHVNDSALVYNKRGNRIRSFPIMYHYHRKWDSELIVNEEGTRLFARYNYRGMARLMELNPTTGEIMGEFKLEQHIYPGKIQIRGDFVYYIFHHYIDYSINYVYKQRLELDRGKWATANNTATSIPE